MQTYFRSSLLRERSDDRKYVCCSQARVHPDVGATEGFMFNLVVTHIQRKKVTQAFNFFMIRKKKEEKKKKNAVTTKIKSTNIS